MLEAIEGMDRAGFESMEFFSATMIKKYVREHKENPWHWIREGTRRARNTSAADARQHPGRAGEEAHGGGQAGGQPPGGQRHPPDAQLQPVERLLGVQAGGGRPARAGHGRRGEHHLLGVAAAHGRVLRAEGPGSRGPEALAHLLQGRGRHAHPGAHPYAGAHRAGEHRRYPGGVPRPLQQRAGAAQLPGSHQARHDHHPHQHTAAGQRLGPALDLQHAPERARHGPYGQRGRGRR